MKLTVHLTIKFRAFLITFANVKQDFVLDVPAEAVLFVGVLADKVKYDNHGVKLTVEVA